MAELSLPEFAGEYVSAQIIIADAISELRYTSINSEDLASAIMARLAQKRFLIERHTEK